MTLSAPIGTPALSSAEIDEMFESAFPLGMPGKGRSAKPTTAVTGTFPLELEHVVSLAAHMESGETLGVTNADIKRIRPTHHRLARLLATGLDETKAALLCNYSPARVSILKSDPAFQELLAGYAGEVDDKWLDTVEVMAGLSEDALHELQARLEETPELFNNVQLMDLAKLTLDRTGNGPTSTQNLNVKAVHMTAADLERLKNDNQHNGSGLGPSPVRPLTAEDRRAIQSLPVHPAAASAQAQGQQLSLPFGDAIREASSESIKEA